MKKDSVSGVILIALSLATLSLWAVTMKDHPGAQQMTIRRAGLFAQREIRITYDESGILEVLDDGKTIDPEAFHRYAHFLKREATDDGELEPSEMQRLESHFIRELLKDGLITDTDDIHIHWKPNGDLFINGARVPDDTAVKYRRMQEEVDRLRDGRSGGAFLRTGKRLIGSLRQVWFGQGGILCRRLNR